MRVLSRAALLVAALAVAAPVAAQQVSSPGPVYYNQSGAPIPGAPMVSPNPPVVTSPGPVYYNQSGAPIPGAPYAQPQISTGGPLYAGPPQVSTGGPLYAGPQGGNNQVWQNGRWVAMPAPGPGHGAGNHNRWGGQVDGRWWGGSQAPGGWGGYRRPRRGHAIDSYWMRPDFRIPDYLSFGLAAPPYGYFWVRYYDDAVLVDARGSVQTSVSGIAWSDASAYAGGGYAASAASASASSGSYGGQMATVDPNQGYYGQPQGGYAPPAVYGPPAAQNTYYQLGCYSACPPVYQGGGYQQGGTYYQGGGYYGGGSTTTTVVIQSPPVITTTIVEEEIVTEEVVTTSYVRAAPRRVVRRAPHRPKPRPVRRQCSCQCVCR